MDHICSCPNRCLLPRPAPKMAAIITNKRKSKKGQSEIGLENDCSQHYCRNTIADNVIEAIITREPGKKRGVRSNVIHSANGSCCNSRDSNKNSKEYSNKNNSNSNNDYYNNNSMSNNNINESNDNNNNNNNEDENNDNNNAAVSDGPVTCQWQNCCLTFETRELLYDHMKIHTDHVYATSAELETLCLWKDCNYGRDGKPRRRDNFNDHLCRHHKFERFHCDACGSNFCRNQALQTHKNLRCKYSKGQKSEDRDEFDGGGDLDDFYFEEDEDDMKNGDAGMSACGKRSRDQKESEEETEEPKKKKTKGKKDNMNTEKAKNAMGDGPKIVVKKVKEKSTTSTSPLTTTIATIVTTKKAKSTNPAKKGKVKPSFSTKTITTMTAAGLLKSVTAISAEVPTPPLVNTFSTTATTTNVPTTIVPDSLVYESRSYQLGGFYDDHPFLSDSNNHVWGAEDESYLFPGIELLAYPPFFEYDTELSGSSTPEPVSTSISASNSPGAESVMSASDIDYSTDREELQFEMAGL